MMTPSPDDRLLVEAARAGQPEAFGVLVRRHQDRLYPTLLRLTGRAEDAADLLQDAFLRAYERLDRFGGESSFFTWLYRIAVNLALSDRRRRKVAGRSPSPLPEGGPEPAADASQTDPSLPLQRAESEVLIQAALDSLNPDHRAVVVLNHLDGLRYEEIAEILDIPVGTVRSRLHRAREVLRERLAALLDDSPTPARTTAPPLR